MRVICIDDWSVDNQCKHAPQPQYGIVYTVVKEVDWGGELYKKFYQLAEFESRYLYWIGAFIPLSSIDETEMIKEREVLVH